MKRNERIAIAILEEAVSGQKRSFEKKVEWKYVIQEFKDQAVLPLGYITLKEKGFVNNSFRADYEKCMHDQILMWYFMLEEQNQLVQLLYKEGFRFAIMKGLTNAAFYPKPEMRTIGDVDFLVDTDEFEQVYLLLLKNGYELKGEMIKEKHHVTFMKDGVEFEMHKRPAGTKRHFSKENQDLINYFREGLSCTQLVEVDGYSFPMLEPVRNGLMLLLHIAGHMQSGIGIRHLLDWAVYVSHFVDNLFWEKKLRRICQKYHVDKLAIVLTRISQVYFGIGHEITWCMSADMDVCDSLLSYMVEQGNFGQKAGDDDSAVRFLTDSQGPVRLLQRIDKSSKYSMPIVLRYPVLRPIGWCFQILRYLYKGIKRRDFIIRFEKDLEISRRRSKLFDELNIQGWQDA